MSKSSVTLKKSIKIVGFIFGLAIFFIIYIFVDLNPQKRAATATLAVALLMAVWWVFEVVPLCRYSLVAGDFISLARHYERQNGIKRLLQRYHFFVFRRFYRRSCNATLEFAQTNCFTNFIAYGSG